jgi:hypothetical protein
MSAARRVPLRLSGSVLVLLAGMSNMIGCASSTDNQFQKQVKRAHECQEIQNKLVGDQPLTPERADEITKTMDQAGCTARLPGR